MSSFGLAQSPASPTLSAPVCQDIHVLIMLLRFHLATTAPTLLAVMERLSALKVCYLQYSLWQSSDLDPICKVQIIVLFFRVPI